LEHLGPGYLLEINNKKILVDAGCGVQTQLIKLGIGIDDLDYIFITHFHPDHAAELLSLIFRKKLARKIREDISEKTVKVFGPVGIEKFVKDLHHLFRLSDYVDWEGVNVSELKGKERADGFTVAPFEIVHKGSDGLAYRFESEGKVITFSGDTVLCDGIKQAAKNADLFISECSYPSGYDTGGYHLISTQVGEIAKEMKVRKVVLTHLLAFAYDIDLVSQVKEKFDGEVILGKDLMELEV